VKRLPILEWDALGMAIETHEPATAVGHQFFQILDRLGYTADEVQAVARALFTCVD
jgi:hypothetical protein